MLSRNAREGSYRWRWAVSLVAATVVAGSAAGATVPAFAVAPADDLMSGMVLDDHGAAIVTEAEHTVIAPGLDRVSLRRISAAGPLHVEVLVAKLGSGSSVRADYLYPGVVSAAETVSDLIDRQDAVAGVNGSFFDINNTNAPNGVGISAADGIVSVPDGTTEGREPVVFTDDGLGAFAQLMLEGSVDLGDAGSLPIAGVNTAVLNTGSVAVFNSLWGEGSRARVLRGGAGVEVWVVDGTVTKVTDQVGAGAIAEDTQILVARGGAAATTLATLEVGDPAAIGYELSENAANVVAAIGGNQRLLTDGSVTSSGDTSVEPRTGVAFADGGSTMYLAVVDGRQQSSIGMSLTQFGQFFKDLGADNAVNLDGGGSSTMLARAAGDEEATLLHNPSDGQERLVPNGLGLFVAQGSGAVAGYRIVPEHSEGDDAARVFAGLHRSVQARGFDEMYAPVAGTTPSWTSSTAAATVTGTATEGLVQGVEPGSATVRAAAGQAEGSFAVQVLGALERVSASTSLLALANAESTGTISLVGHDAQGYEAPIDPVDVTVTGNDGGLLQIVPGALNTFQVTPTTSVGSAELHFDVQGRSVDVAVTVGLTDTMISSLEDAAQWRASGARATMTVNADPNGRTGTAVHLTYDFSQQPGTRTANLYPPARYPVPGQPQAIKVWARGTTSIGANAATYLGFRDANGTTKFVYSTAPMGNDWQQIAFPIPQGTAYPIELSQFAAYETNADKLYRGEMWFDDATAEIAPDVELPVAPLVTSSLVAPDGATDSSPQRVAIMSDAQFVARDPDSGQVRGAREALQEIVAAKPDAMFIVGDFVDEASPADFQLAKQILDEELANAAFPWYYIPGNHEIMGTSNLANFTEVFGDPVRTVDQDGTRFIMLDTSTGAISKRFTQLEMLRDQLDDAETNPDITGVVVLQHMPVDDPLINKASQLVNRQDAELEQGWLEDFRETSGKSVALVAGHVGVFHTKIEDGIPYVINGNSGKNPTVSPEFGEFTGWTMLGVDPAAGVWRSDATAARAAEASEPWFTVETQTRVEQLDVAEPDATLAPGDEVALDPSLTQDDTRVLDLAWPMSWAWTGTKHVFVGAPADAPRSAIAAIDPQTNVLTALRAGSGEVTLTMNEVSVAVPFAIKGGRHG